MILIVCWWGWRWGEEGRCSWWYGYWGTDSLGRGVTLWLLSFWQRRMTWLGEISRGRFSLFWAVLFWQILCKLGVWWNWAGRLWPAGVWTSLWVWWCGCMAKRVIISWETSQRIHLCIPWRLLIKWLSLWLLLEQWLLILLFVWWWIPGCNHLRWRIWLVVPVSKTWSCHIAHLQCELLCHVAYIIGGIAVSILWVVLQLSTYN